MIKGLDKFKAHFAQYPDSYLMIGGVACHEWFQAQGLEFRATKDLDVVIIIEALTQAFVEHFWKFINGHHDAFLGPGCHSTSQVLLTSLAGSQSPSNPQARTILPVF
ncbi:MAG TPA: hypothetical protein VNW54_08425 [Granulicella sp.]|jgi:hypothetical protein|nr:hypothetical protein [Granulicella sp.]